MTAKWNPSFLLKKRGQSANHRLRVDGGGLLTAFLLEVAADNHKTQGKEAEEEGVFLRFGDDLAVDDNPNRAVGLRRKKRRPSQIESIHSLIIEGSRKEIANGFVDDARARPSGRIPGGIGQSASRDANPNVISATAIFIHEKMGNGSASAADGDGRRVGGAGGKGDVGSAAAGNSGSHRSDVVGVGTGKQRRKRKVGVAGFVGVEEVSAIEGRGKLPRVWSIVIIGSCSDAAAPSRRRRAAKNPKGLAGGAILAGIDINEQLRLALLGGERKEKKAWRPPQPLRSDNYRPACR